MCRSQQSCGVNLIEACHSFWAEGPRAKIAGLSAHNKPTIATSPADNLKASSVAGASSKCPGASFAKPPSSPGHPSNFLPVEIPKITRRFPVNNPQSIHPASARGLAIPAWQGSWRVLPALPRSLRSKGRLPPATMHSHPCRSTSSW